MRWDEPQIVSYNDIRDRFRKRLCEYLMSRMVLVKPGKDWLIYLILKLNYIDKEQKVKNTDPICNGEYKAIRTMKTKNKLRRH